MKVVSWNANWKFREKFQLLDDCYHADLYVIQECEDPSRTNHREYQLFAKNSLWIGENKNIGLGVFAHDKDSLKKINLNNYYLRYFLPFEYDGRLFLGIWSHDHYVEDIVVYLAANADYIAKKPIVIGDFNSNASWDTKHGYRTHSVMNTELENAGLFSVYHYLTGEVPGKESTATYYQHRHQNERYHIDYCYAPKDEIVHFDIGQYKKWGSLSDHMPLMVELR